MKKRRNGFGTVYRRGSDNRWVAAVTRRADGRRVRRVSYHATLSDAVDGLRALRSVDSQGC